MTTASNKKHVGLVLAGAGARGAYEAGAVSVLLPELARRDELPTVLVGTSAGAITAAFLASRAPTTVEDAETTAKELLELWRGIDRSDVMLPMLSALWTVPLYVGASFLQLGARGALDVAPLRATLDDAMGDWSSIRANVDSGALNAIGIVATSVADGTSVVFTAAGSPLPPTDLRKGIRYEPANIATDHVLASAAIPMAFPPVWIAEGASAGWYIDGGTRLNTPIKPALKLGVDRVVIVATDPATRSGARSPRAATVRPPDFDDAFLHLIQASLADPLIEDMHRLAGINSLVARRKTGPKRACRYLFVGPATQGEFGRLAERTISESRPRSLTDIEYRVLRWFLGRQGTQGAELLSYLLFDPGFISECITAGQEHAHRELERTAGYPSKWRLGPM